MKFNCVFSSFFFFFSSRRRHTRFDCDWSSDVCSSDLMIRHTRFDCDWSLDVCSSDLLGEVERLSTHDQVLGASSAKRFTRELCLHEPPNTLSCVEVETTSATGVTRGWVLVVRDSSPTI